MSSPFSPACSRAKNRALSDAALPLVARRFAVLAEPMRLRLVQRLFAGEKNATQLAAALGGTPANISRHLQTLTAAGVLGRRKAGLQVFYAIADPSVYHLCEIVCGSLERQLTQQADAFAHRRDRPGAPSGRT